MKLNRSEKSVRKPTKSSCWSITAPQDQPVNSQPPSSDEVACRAYRNYQSHGAADGHDVEDWLCAEAELLAERHIANCI